jgi:hypothetical protein
MYLATHRHALVPTSRAPGQFTWNTRAVKTTPSSIVYFYFQNPDTPCFTDQTGELVCPRGTFRAVKPNYYIDLLPEDVASRDGTTFLQETINTASMVFKVPVGLYRIQVTGNISYGTGGAAPAVRWDDYAAEFNDAQINGPHASGVAGFDPQPGYSINIFNNALPNNSSRAETVDIFDSQGIRINRLSTVNFDETREIIHGNTRFGFYNTNEVHNFSGNLTVDITRLN